jgi:hypothetical protein
VRNITLRTRQTRKKKDGDSLRALWLRFFESSTARIVHLSYSAKTKFVSPADTIVLASRLGEACSGLMDVPVLHQPLQITRKEGELGLGK